MIQRKGIITPPIWLKNDLKMTVDYNSKKESTLRLALGNITGFQSYCDCLQNRSNDKRDRWRRSYFVVRDEILEFIKDE